MYFSGVQNPFMREFILELKFKIAQNTPTIDDYNLSLSNWESFFRENSLTIITFNTNIQLLHYQYSHAQMQIKHALKLSCISTQPHSCIHTRAHTHACTHTDTHLHTHI